MKNIVMAFIMAVTLAVGFFYEPPANANVSLIHVDEVHIVEPWENAEEIAKQYLPYNKEFKTVQAFAVAIRRANGFQSFVPGRQVIIPLAYEKE